LRGECQCGRCGCCCGRGQEETAAVDVHLVHGCRDCSGLSVW
jgi:hypothetical protein